MCYLHGTGVAVDPGVGIGWILGAPGVGVWQGAVNFL